MPKEPTRFSKMYPPKRADLPEEYKAVLTWRPTQKLQRLRTDTSHSAGGEE